jgi:8-oxo-dGTP pyrophosphatase MutT (NUDIX family)
MTFDELWRSVWGSAADTHKNDYEVSERKYATIAEGNISKLLDAYPTVWLEPEWGFPKGRRNSGETEIQAAVREFEEETNINRSHLYTIQNIRPFVETFYGSNNVQYCHKYFVSLCDNVTLTVIHDNPHMNREIGSIGWYTIDQAIEKIRPDSKEKRELLLIVKELMRTLCPVII